MRLIRLTVRLSRRRENSADPGELNALVHGADDVCLAQELVRDSDSERDAAVGDCRGFGHALHVANSPLGWRCTPGRSQEQMTSVFSGFRSAPTLALATSKSWRWATPGLGDT